ncbi:hypothetical protein [Saccharicrinis sp. FJH54]|uniref:gliding motility lipoprotein GldB n=1 Tax=Saccharicrinis sp. FJH54 TaxID=3344665 RepID=UPI0035D4E8BB
MKYPVFTFILISALLFACKKNDRFAVNTDDININMHFIRFDQELGKEDTVYTKVKIDSLQARYSGFFQLYTSRVIKIGVPGEKNFELYFNRYITDTVYCQVYDSVEQRFSTTQLYDNVIRNGFKRYHFFFPEQNIPDIYYMISGFNESVVVSDNILAISLEDYLGINHSFYKWLSIYEYIRNNMYPDKIPSDALWAWLQSEYPYQSTEQTLLSRMIYDGKILFVLKQLLPDEPTQRILGYTQQQLQWCKLNEKAMWSYIIENKHLFSKDLLTIKKYTDPAPFTQYFGNESAPRAGAFIGYQIVTAFMENNKDISLSGLLNLTDSQDILGKSGFRP